MNRVQQPRTLLVLGLNAGMSTAAGADELCSLHFVDWPQFLLPIQWFEKWTCHQGMFMIFLYIREVNVIFIFIYIRGVNVVFIYIYIREVNVIFVYIRVHMYTPTPSQHILAVFKKVRWTSLDNNLDERPLTTPCPCAERIHVLTLFWFLAKRDLGFYFDSILILGFLAKRDFGSSIFSRAMVVNVGRFSGCRFSGLPVLQVPSGFQSLVKQS